MTEQDIINCMAEYDKVLTKIIEGARSGADIGILNVTVNSATISAGHLAKLVSDREALSDLLYQLREAKEQQ